MERDQFPPAVRARWQMEDTQRWLEKSGPLFADVEVACHKHYDDMTLVLFDDRENYEPLRPEAISIASWIYLRAAAPGAFVTLKLRIDDVAVARK